MQSKLISAPEFVSSRTDVFPSASSFEWFCRRNRQRLIKAEALSRPNGRNLVDAERFDAVIREVGLAKFAEAA